MKLLSVVFIVICTSTTLAQTFTSELRAMVDAENAFAKYSKDKNTRDAFLLYMTDSTVMFDKNVPTKGKKGWEERTPNNNLLFWYPEFVGIAKSGELGFSTGPWEWSPTKESPKPDARGYYATIWQKFPDGWKMAVDLGGIMPGPHPNADKLHASNPKGKSPKGKTKKTVLDIDKEYIETLNDKKAGFIADNFSSDAFMIRAGSFPDYYPFKKVNDARRNFKFSASGGAIAASNDLAYSYGVVQFETTKDGSTVAGTGCFLRVWKLDDGQWKIILDVIGGQG